MPHFAELPEATCRHVLANVLADTRRNGRLSMSTIVDELQSVDARGDVYVWDVCVRRFSYIGLKPGGYVLCNMTPPQGAYPSFLAGCL